MERTQRLVVLSQLASAMRARESWCGETHLQKAVYLLQALLHVDTGYEYVLYKHGPYCFDLHDDLNAMIADGLLEMEPRPPYRPALFPTTTAEGLVERFGKTAERYRRSIDFVADKIGQADVWELERLATTLFLLLDRPEENDEELAEGLHSLKRHISRESALEALERVKGLAQEAVSVRSL
jgi:uncharacterized protein YwgA